MQINIKSPLITFAVEGKPFPYDRLFLNTFEEYIRQHKNCDYGQLTKHDQSIALAKIIRKMEVNGVKVQEFFKEDLDKWSNLENFDKIWKLIDVMSHDMFCCFDPNLYGEGGEIATSDRLYCVNEDGERDFVMYVDEKPGIFKKKVITPEGEYFADLMRRFKAGELPKKK